MIKSLLTFNVYTSLMLKVHIIGPSQYKGRNKKEFYRNWWDPENTKVVYLKS